MTIKLCESGELQRAGGILTIDSDVDIKSDIHFASANKTITVQQLDFRTQQIIERARAWLDEVKHVRLKNMMVGVAGQYEIIPETMEQMNGGVGYRRDFCVRMRK